MDSKFIEKMLRRLIIPILSFLLLACKAKNDFTGVWISQDYGIYINTTIQISDDNKVFMSYLPHGTIISIDDVIIADNCYFDSDFKEGNLIEQNKTIRYKNYSEDVDAIIVFSTSTEMEILFPDGTRCNFIKENQ